ncbi:hypothetical protein KO494_12035 [Lacinutrix sp. C3R15]|nr:MULTISPECIES: hypothetical protein [Flavobacteriaceae]MBU2940268.1 hypothetical protein [Lacinutrix sp. C3R15]MDO6623587.1 hypothetical protein [Oceanihabitans sp. 1_MG-2023]
MSTHYCKVGKKRPNENKVFSIKTIENKAKQIVDSMSNQKPTQDFDVAT